MIMISPEKAGKRIALFRKEKQLSQEQLAELVHVSPQAVSKWETGKSLPETSTLPLLSQVLGCSIDSLLLPQKLTVLAASYTDGCTDEDITAQLGRFVRGDSLSVMVNAASIPVTLDSDRLTVLLAKYELDGHIGYSYAVYGEMLQIGPSSVSCHTHSGELEFVYAAYGNGKTRTNVMQKLKHYQFFRWNHYSANHEQFPSHPDNDGADYLLLVYTNASGIHAVSCAEGEQIHYREDRTSLYRMNSRDSSYIVENVDRLRFGEGKDCSWAGALLASFHANGIEAAYETLMGVSGACWRIAFAPIWDYSSADGLVAFDYAAPAFRAYGIRPAWADRISRGERKLEKQRIMESIQRHELPVAINLRVAPEWGVITGYLDNGNTLLCRSYFDDETFTKLQHDPAFQEDMKATKGYLYADNWPFAIVHFDGRVPVPSALENLLVSLQLRNDSMNLKESRGYMLGYQALEAWREGLLDENWYLAAAAGDADRRRSVNHFCMTALTDARRSAAAYLQQCCSLPEAAPIMEQLEGMKEIYLQMSGKLQAFYNRMPTDEAAQGMPAGLAWPPQSRKAQAELLSDIIEAERRAEIFSRTAIGMMKLS